MLTIQVLITTAVNNILKYFLTIFFFFFEREKIRLDIPCELDNSHEMLSLIFTEKNNNKKT